MSRVPTSIAAYDSITEHTEDLRARVFSAILHAPDGLTCDEAETITGLKHTTVSARIYELAGKGKDPAKRRPATIVDSGKRRLTESGRGAIVWIPAIRQTNLREII